MFYINFVSHTSIVESNSLINYHKGHGICNRIMQRELLEDGVNLNKDEVSQTQNILLTSCFH